MSTMPSDVSTGSDDAAPDSRSETADDRDRAHPGDEPGNLLCVCNFPSDTGFAWDFIGALYAGVAEALEVHGVRTWVAYPKLNVPPKALQGSPARPLEFEVRLGDVRSCIRVAELIRQRRIRTLYLSDRAVWHPAYLVLRAAGVRSIVVHDHTSGARTVPRGWKRLAKQARMAVPGACADRVLAVSDYVARRKREVNLVPPDRVTRVWNSVVLPDREGAPPERDIRAFFELEAGAPVVAAASRASPEKGVAFLMRAFDRIVQGWEADRHGIPPLLVYMGDGPALDRLKRLRMLLESRDRIRLPGYVDDSASLLGSAEVAVLPSVWDEAFGLAALEPMSRGVPVVASRVGGVPEVIRDGEEGLLVPPADVEALERAIRRLLLDPEERAAMGRRGRERSRALFSRRGQIEELAGIFEDELGLSNGATG